MSESPQLPSNDTLRSLLLSTTLKEFLRGDLLVGVLGGAGATWLALAHPEALRDAVPVASTLVGVVVGVVIATATIVGAFLNPVFLRKMRAIDEDPVDYMAPYLLSGVVGAVASILCVCLAALPDTTPEWLFVAVGGFAGLAVLWALASIVPNLTNLIRFIRLQQDAAEVPDDLPVIGTNGRRRDTGA